MIKFIKHLLAPSAEAIQEKVAPPAKPKIKRVMYLEDNETDCDLMKNLLSDWSIALTLVNSLAEARELVCEVPPFDSMFLDVRLSNGSGINFYAEVLNQFPKTHVVFLSGYATEDIEKEVARIGPARVHNKRDVMRHSFIDPLLLQWGFSKI